MDLKKMRKEKWTKESVEIEAKKYNSKWRFARKCSGGFKYAIRHDLIKNFYWFEKKSKPMGYWTKKRCEQEAKKYKSKTEYKKNAAGAYESSRKNGWLNDYYWLENKNICKDKIDSIYGYFFPNNTVYIGRTLNPRNRDKDHRQPKKNDSVFKYAKEQNIEIPQMTIIEEGITVEEGKKLEQKWIDYYKNKNFNVLNKQRGGGIGSITFNKYSKEKIIEETLKYRSRKEFMEKSPNFYYHSWKSGILKELIPSIQVNKRGFWQDRKNVEEESKKFETLKEFIKKSKGAYDAAQKGGYLNELVWLKRKRRPYKGKKIKD